MDVMIAVFDGEMNVLGVSRALACRWGKEPAGLLGKNYFALYPDAEKQALFSKAASTGETMRHWERCVNRTSDGEARVGYCQWNLCPVTGESGKVTNLVLAVVDVTETVSGTGGFQSGAPLPHSVEDALETHLAASAAPSARYYEFTEAVLETIGSLVIVLDTQGRIVLFNQACEHTTGYRRDEVIGQCFWEFLVIEEERPGVKAVFNDLRQGLVPNSHENYWLTKDGRLRWIAWSNTVLRDALGNIDYIIGTGVDMTERRQTEAALRDSEQQFRLLAENIDEMFWLASPDRKIMYYISPAFETIWGLPLSAFYADPMVFLATTPEEDRAIIRADHAEQAKGIFRDSYVREFRIRRPDGEVRWIASRYVPVLNEAGQVFRVAGISRDVTESKQAEQERLRREQLQRDALVREVHHRIKNALQGVIGLLRLHSYDHPQLCETIGTAIARVTTLSLVHGLQSKTTGEAISLYDMCEAIAANIAGTARSGGRLQLIPHAPVQCVIAERYAVPLALVINELMVNALKHSSGTGDTAIPVQLDTSADGVILRIRNRGPTLPEGLDVMRGIGVGTGLGLVRTLLPKGASVALNTRNGWIETEFRMSCPPICAAGKG